MGYILSQIGSTVNTPWGSVKMGFGRKNKAFLTAKNNTPYEVLHLETLSNAICAYATSRLKKLRLRFFGTAAPSQDHFLFFHNQQLRNRRPRGGAGQAL